MNRYKVSRLATAVALQAAIALPAYAQIEEMVVSGSPIRDSEMAAIDAKRHSDN